MKLGQQAGLHAGKIVVVFAGFGTGAAADADRHLERRI